MARQEFLEANARFDWAVFVEANGGQREGRFGEYLMMCPVCGKEKLSVNVKRRRWRCFSCDDGGYDALSLVVRIKQCLWPEAVELVLSRFIRPVGSLNALTPLRAEDDDGRRPLGWKPRPIAWPKSFEFLNDQTDIGRFGIAYACGERGILPEVARAMRLGVCSRGRDRNRLIFPECNHDGFLVFYQGRAMWRKHESEERHIKVLGPEIVDHKRDAGPADCLLNLQYLLRVGVPRRVLLVEGPVDTAHAWPDAVGSFGKHVSPMQMMLLAQAGVKELDLGLDLDAVKTLHKVAPVLADMFDVRVVTWPPGKDPGMLSKAEIEACRARAYRWGGEQRQRDLPALQVRR